MKLWPLAIFILFAAAIVASLFVLGLFDPADIQSEPALMASSGPLPLPSPEPSPTPSPSNSITPKARVVPFTPQAPLAQWDDPVFQDGCEEASILMAWSWVNGTGIIDASAEIQKISDYQLEKYNEFRDRSAADTAQLMRDYFDYHNVSVQRNISIIDIKEILRQGSIAVIPMNGQALGNPHFTSPGPERHMLVVHGYDEKTDEFITNDPGTKHGQGYRYRSDVFFNAIRDYPTGFHVAITEVNKVMIVVN